jgi:hypothetical protein
MGTPAFYTVSEQQIGKALMEAYRTGRPIKVGKLRKEFIARLIQMGVIKMHTYSTGIHTYTLVREKFLELVNVVPNDIYLKLIDPVERQKWSAKSRGFSSLEAYQNRSSVKQSDKNKAIKRAPYKGTREQVLASKLPVSEDILFTGPIKRQGE